MWAFSSEMQPLWVTNASVRSPKDNFKGAASLLVIFNLWVSCFLKEKSVWAAALVASNDIIFRITLLDWTFYTGVNRKIISSIFALSANCNIMVFTNQCKIAKATVCLLVNNTVSALFIQKLQSYKWPFLDPNLNSNHYCQTYDVKLKKMQFVFLNLSGNKHRLQMEVLKQGPSKVCLTFGVMK